MYFILNNIYYIKSASEGLIEIDDEDELSRLEAPDPSVGDKFKTLLQKCRKIASAMHHSTLLGGLLIQKQVALELPQHQIPHDMPTRWNSIFLMFQRIIEQHEAINETFDDNLNRRKFDNLKICEEEKNDLVDIVNVLQCFYDATLELSASKYVTISIVVPVFNTLLNMMRLDDSDSDLTRVLKQILFSNTKHYIDKYNILGNHSLIVATLLDVRTKTFGKVSEKQRKEFLKIAQEYIKHHSPDANNSETVSASVVLRPRLNIFDFDHNITSNKAKKQLKGLDKELFEYINEPVRNIDPIEYWKINKEVYPTLFKIFKKVFCIPATSVPAEQLFSHAGYNVWDRRNKLKPSNVNKMMFTYENCEL